MDGNEGLDPSGIEPGHSVELRALTARVAELELQVAALVSQAWQEPVAAARREQRIAPLTGAPPPPPPAQRVGLPGLETQVWASADAARERQVSPASGGAKKSLEDRLGSQVFNVVGMVALIFGAAWALKLAIEHGWIGPAARVIVGLFAGSGVILGSEVFRRKDMAAFSYSLKAVGTGVLYLSLWAAFQLYGVLPGPAALACMILVTAWNAYMAFSQNAELLAGYALLGALLTPVLLSTGGDHETFLFSYLTAVDAATVLLQRYKAWPRLLLPCFSGTAAFFVGYFVRFFHVAHGEVWDGQSTETALFALVFFSLFALVSLKWWGRERAGVESGLVASVLIPLGNSAFLGGALYVVFEDSGLHSWLAWLMLALAAMLLGLARLQRTATASAMHLAAAVVFLTIAIPLKASGQTLTTAWLVEGLVLYWAATRVQGESAASGRVLGLLSLAGYGLGLGSVLAHWTWNWGFEAQPAFFSANLGSAMVAVCVLAGAVWLALAKRKAESTSQAVVIGALCGIDALALLLAARELDAGWSLPALHSAFTSADFNTALAGLSLLAVTSWVAWRLSRERFAGAEQKVFRLVGCIDLVLFNVVAILTVECEISSLWHRQEASLQRSLAISGFLMLYGAALLAIGFWRRSAFVRWQALLLIVFTIAKVFLYDISGLSAGYRVVSFLALGALLMSVSFAYQKDWLGLKTPAAAPEAGT